jgi:hypothetical protein
LEASKIHQDCAKQGSVVRRENYLEGPEEDKLWMDFVFGDEDCEILRNQALREATEEAVRYFTPQDTSDINRTMRNQGAEVHDFDTVATCGSDPVFQHTAHDTALEFYTASMVVEPATTPQAHGSETTASNEFRFVQPKGFVGRFAETSTTAELPVVSLATERCSRARSRTTKSRVTIKSADVGTEGRRRRRTRSNDGRPAIREVPDYADDPIEE